MLLPNNIQPEDSFYYLGAQIIGFLSERQGRCAPLGELVEWAIGTLGSSAAAVIFALDWLFLIDSVSLSSKGEIALCS